MWTVEDVLLKIHGMQRFGIKPGLFRIKKLLEILGNPQEDIKVIHIAGTNGKGSTSSMIDSILRAHGYRVGLYTSPYLEVFNERIRLNGENIADEDLVQHALEVFKALDVMEQQGIEPPTEFEVVTALAFSYYKDKDVDFLVLEVGMGGRLDATNVVVPLVSVITPISFDHKEYLGNTLEEIAREKCGIIKKKVPVVTSLQEDEAIKVIEETCKETDSKLYKVGEHIKFKLLNDDLSGQIFELCSIKNYYENLKITLLGRHQLSNASTAVGAVEVLSDYGIPVIKEKVAAGLYNAKWAGRFEILKEKPYVIIDGAHNEAGCEVLKKSVLNYFGGKRKIFVLGILKDKDYINMLKILVPIADMIITTKPESPRALTSKELKEAIEGLSLKNIPVINEDDIEKALEIALNCAKEDDIVIFAGSLYMIGKVRGLLKK